MDVGEAIGLVSEVLTLIGLGGGLPLLLYGALRRHQEGKRVPTEIVILYDDHGAQARWFAEDDFYARRLRARESAAVHGAEYCEAFVHVRDPSCMYLTSGSSIVAVSLALGSVFVGVGVLGLGASLVALLI